MELLPHDWSTTEQFWTLRKITFQKMKHITIIANRFQGKISYVQSKNGQFDPVASEILAADLI